MSAFLDEIDLTPLPDGRNWRVVNLFRYISTMLGRIITIPAGRVTDLASTPRLVWNIFPPFGKYTGAAVVHDELYTTGEATREQADAVLLEAMETEGVGFFTRHTIYRAVRLFGWAAWNEHRKDDMKKMSIGKTITTLILLAGALVTWSGCAIDRYTDPSGAKFTRASLLYPLRVESIALDVAGTNGTKKTLDVKGYANEQTALVQALAPLIQSAAQGAAAGAAKGAQ